ncbi:3-keto-disaccharide hydrolase [Catenovulum sediminis]|uniref:DUF1080 domain-containing protein n=1 Tax=Catenovulum sediminis TaxID=1740262 RepID=A0ABV1RLG8_9ALTE
MTKNRLNTVAGRLWLVSAILLLSACSNTQLNIAWQPLLTNDLTNWEVWIGVPHSSVKGLPEGTLQQDHISQHGDPNDAIGLNQDIKNVFQLKQNNGTPELHVSGEIYGGLSTKAHYENYHLSLKMRWGDKKWAPRLNKLRDSGLLFHCRGEHGAFWRVWKLCQEYQIQETDLGDYIPLGNHNKRVTGKIRYRMPEQGDRPIYDANGKLGTVGYASASPEVDNPHGEWNTLELFAFADKAVFVANGKVVMVVQDLKDENNQPLTSGQLQLQSEGAELVYKDIKIRSMTKMPERFATYFN